MERLLLASFGVIILAGRLCAADVYYFTAASTSFSTASNFVADQNNTLGTASPAWSLNAGYNVDLINSATALGTKNVDLSANMTVGAFSNTSSAPGGEWIFYSQDSATNTWNFDSITQNSAVNLRFRKRQGATGLVLNITNGISVGKGILWLGHTDNSQQITSLTVGGNTSITSGGTLNIVDHGTANFKDTITNTNGTLSFINNGTAKPTGAQVISVKNIVSNNNSAGSLDIGKIDSYAKYVSTDTANRIMNFNAGDISAENSRNTVSINVDTFRVDSALYEGATGTLRYSAAGTGNRLKMLVQNAYIENFIVGEESGSVKSYVEITRGTDILDYSAAGTFEVGKLTSLYTMGEVRIGYLYLGTDNYANYTKYETIKIGEANISRGMSLVAENIEIGSFTKNAVESGENMDFGKVENGLFAENITIGEAGADGAASESVSTLHDGIVTLYGRSVNIHGTLNLAPTNANISTELNIGTIRDSEGSILKQSVNIDALNFDTSVAAANARFNANISDLSINDVNFSGGSSAVLYAAADNGAKIGNVSVSTWMNGAVKTKTDKAYIDISGNASIDKISFKGLYTNSNENTLYLTGSNATVGIGLIEAAGQNIFSTASKTTIDKITLAPGASTATWNKLSIVGNGAMEDMLIKQVDFNPRNSLTLGTAANKLGNVRIDILNMTGNATGADGADRATSVNLAAGKVLSIGQFNIAGNGVSRMDGTNADLEIGEMNIANSTSGAYTVTAGKTITIGTLNKTAGAGHRFGADTSYLTGTFSITDLNTSAGTLNFYTSDATSIGTLTSGGSGTATNFYSNASIGTLNFDGTSSGVSNAVGKTLSVGSINVLKGTANLNGSMAVAGVITLSQATMLNLSGSFDGSTVSTQGLVAESSNQNTHATSSKNTTLVLNGDGHYTFRGRLHDFEAAATPVAGQKEISVVKDGEGAQYLRGETYYRGDTLVNSGELYINADGSGNTAGLGVGKVFLNGGALGATGQDSEIGTLKMTQLTWAAGAVLNFDIGTGGYDKIIVSGDILRATQSLEGFMLFSAGDYAINITLLEGAIFDESAPYELISWTGNNEIVGEEITVNFTNSDEYKGKIVFDEYGMKLQISAAPIPEPSEIAALFGACSLLFAFYRRKREGK